jgi:hypothetical protein
MSASEREPIVADKVSITPTTTEEHEFNTEGMGVTILDDDDKEPIDIPPQAQEIIDDAKGKLELIDEGYRLRKENIELTSVIETFGLIKEKYTALEKENAALKKKLDEYQHIPSNDALVNRIDQQNREIAELRQENEWLLKQERERLS